MIPQNILNCLPVHRETYFNLVFVISFSFYFIFSLRIIVPVGSTGYFPIKMITFKFESKNQGTNALQGCKLKIFTRFKKKYKFTCSKEKCKTLYRYAGEHVTLNSLIS
jgi:hypothetical protein